MLTEIIDKLIHGSTLQQEVKLDTGEFDPFHQLRHFLLILVVVRDDGLRVREQNKRQRNA